MTNSTDMVNISLALGIILGAILVSVLVYTMGNEVVNVDVLNSMCEKMGGKGSTFMDSFGPTSELVCIKPEERITPSIINNTPTLRHINISFEEQIINLTCSIPDDDWNLINTYGVLDIRSYPDFESTHHIINNTNYEIIDFDAWINDMDLCLVGYRRCYGLEDVLELGVCKLNTPLKYDVVIDGYISYSDVMYISPNDCVDYLDCRITGRLIAKFIRGEK